jgi:cephalosporin hydroxylase
MEETQTIDIVLDAGSDSLEVFGGRYEGGLCLQQVPDEIAPVLDLLKEKLNPDGVTPILVLEIGSAAGGTVALIHRVIGIEAAVLVDDNAHGRAHMRPDVLCDVPATEIVGDSSDDNVASQVADAGFDFDLLHIDGDHSYDGASADFEKYGALVRPGGFVMFHDTVHWSTPGVKKLVSEIKAMDNWVCAGEFVSATHANPCGIALFQKQKGPEIE